MAERVFSDAGGSRRWPRGRRVEALLDDGSETSHEVAPSVEGVEHASEGLLDHTGIQWGVMEVGGDRPHVAVDRDVADPERPGLAVPAARFVEVEIGKGWPRMILGWKAEESRRRGQRVGI